MCSAIFASVARTAFPIGTGESPFDAPERQTDNGAVFGAIGATWHVPQAIAQTLAKINRKRQQAKPMDGYVLNMVGIHHGWVVGH